MKFSANLLVFVMGLCVFCATAFGGELDPGTGPNSTTGYTLNDIWNRLNSGADGVPYSAFLEPAVDPTGTVGIVKTLYDIMMAAPKKDELKGADPEDVLSGKTYWGLTGANWGEQTGTLPNVGQQNITCGASNQTIAKGYHDGTGTVAGDGDLAAGNILKGVEIFGITGTLTGAIGDAVAEQVLSGKSFSNSQSSGIVGAMPDKGAVSITPGAASQSIPAGYHNGSGTVAGDANLTAANIKNGVSIFGIDGTALIPSGDASASEVLTGKTFSNASGTGISGTMPNIGQQNITPGTSAASISEGYHDGTGEVAGDANLSADNIKDGVNIFGVAGTYPLAGVAKTGQTGCWNEAGDPITCTNTGQDGDYQKGISWPSPRFTDNGDGTVTDNLTGLMWLKNANCAGTQMTWENALTWCNNLSSGQCSQSYSDWRLPNRNELASLVDSREYSPTLPAGHPFQNVQSSLYWSGTTNASFPSNAWYVYMNNGDVNYAYKTVTPYVWPVRGGQ